MKNAVLVVILAAMLAGCANADSSAPERTTSPTTSTSEATMKPDALYVSTIKKGTTGVIADEPKQLSAGVANVTTDGRTALDVKIQGKGAYGIVYLRDGEDFEIDGIPFHIETSRRAGRSPYTSYAASAM
ncbi:MAG: hypothetical protein ACRDTT_19260 [Pseudonocardiaceae bacterium]